MSYEKINEELLLKIFHIPSPSTKEDKIRDFIVDFLTTLQIPFIRDVAGNIFNIDNEGQPLLSAHMDTVQKETDCDLSKFIRIIDYEYEEKDSKKIKTKRILKGLGVIGGDDKCGIYIILEILSKYKNINFIFSVGEEIGCTGIMALVKEEANKKKLEKCSYGLILDRRFGANIICVKNSYGTQVFEDALQKQLKDFGYKSEAGACSDANHIRESMSCANLSVGYHEPHTIREFVILSQLLNSLKGVEATITNLKERFIPVVLTSVKEYNYKKNSFGPYHMSTYQRSCSICHVWSYTADLLGKDVCTFCLRDLKDSLNDHFADTKKGKKGKSAWFTKGYDEFGAYSGQEGFD